MRNISKIQLLSYVLFALSAVILSFAIYMNLNISVLENWNLTIDKKEAHIGDTLVVMSTYKKTMNVSGTSTRYLECKNSDNIYIRYPVSEATANRSTGTGGTAVIIVIPPTINDIPTTCKVSINIVYQVFFLRQVVESSSSNEFRLLQKDSASSTNDGTDTTSISNSVQQNAEQPKAIQQAQQQQKDNSVPNTTISPDSKQLSGNPLPVIDNSLINVLLNK